MHKQGGCFLKAVYSGRKDTIMSVDNSIRFIGHLPRDPEVTTYGQEGNQTARISIAVNRRFKKDGQTEADFFSVTAFGKSAEFAQKYLAKGRKVAVEGRIQNDNYEKDGQKVYRDSIIVDEIKALSPAPNQQGVGAYQQAAPAPQADPAAAYTQAAPAPQAAPAQQTFTQQAPPPQAAPPQQASIQAFQDDEDDLPF
jgi:single-strand DNA-binding protein